MAWRDLGRVAGLLNSQLPLRQRPDVSDPDYAKWEAYYQDRKVLLLYLAQLLVDIADCGKVARGMLKD